MPNAWGTSWGDAWGVSWGGDSPAPPFSSPGIGGKPGYWKPGNKHVRIVRLPIDSEDDCVAIILAQMLLRQ